ncbi:hypothetical protein QFZ66_005860 [Streptomyces sp. B4I13]|uniref:hypothetical protein n=1 Tax=Streptomyces sp. B4I13 TaxID=3042271 RepID=UPI0027860965|nr:hypothetical protein [Streptomyces sp. B4I13]MDQ0961982.1 hypothetical protein [Streptomyces sp. B4I13]
MSNDYAERLAAAAPAVHRFFDTTEAYDASQCYEEIKDGDLLVVENEQAIAIVVDVYPVAATVQHGEFHAGPESVRLFRERRYAASMEAAGKVAAELGITLDPQHSPRPDGPQAPHFDSATTDREEAPDADPGAAQTEESGEERPAPIEIPRMLVQPGDVLHAFGARLNVIDTGIRINPAASEAQWWADVEGVTDLDRRSTYRGRWVIGVPVATAAWDVVTVERAVTDPRG